MILRTEKSLLSILESPIANRSLYWAVTGGVKPVDGKISTLDSLHKVTSEIPNSLSVDN